MTNKPYWITVYLQYYSVSQTAGGCLHRFNTILELHMGQQETPVLSAEKYIQLEKNILEKGRLLSRLIVWDGTVTDEHNRLRILKEQLMEFKRINRENRMKPATSVTISLLKQCWRYPPGITPTFLVF